MVLTLGTLDPVYSLAKSQIMKNSTVSSLSATSLTEECRSCSVISHYYTASNRFTLATQRRHIAGGHGGGHADMEG